MRPAFTFVMVTSAIGGLQMFDYVFIVFPNATYGPGGVAKTLGYYCYRFYYYPDTTYFLSNISKTIF